MVLDYAHQFDTARNDPPAPAQGHAAQSGAVPQSHFAIMASRCPMEASARLSIRELSELGATAAPSVRCSPTGEIYARSNSAISGR